MAGDRTMIMRDPFMSAKERGGQEAAGVSCAALVPCTAGKLDWMLQRDRTLVVSKAIGNHDYAMSDHKWLITDVYLRSGAPQA
ncbi:hypothetical protein FOA52_005204 [Chlamydomonas sp. UWO 241]|nr:hypothetical protein FOA52_005204 [Chlamydomonas sp. UWO 241]